MPGLPRSLLLIGLVAAAPLAAQGAPARWTLVREARIGAEDGPGALTEVRELVVDPRGTVYVG